MKKIKKKVVTKSKSEWLNRSLVFCPYYALFLNEKDYNRELDKLKVPLTKREAFITSEKAGAQCHYYENEKKETAIFVALNNVYKDHDICTIFSLLTHEAMHMEGTLRVRRNKKKENAKHHNTRRLS